MSGVELALEKQQGRPLRLPPYTTRVVLVDGTLVLVICRMLLYG
jgi:hypothetical protein